MDELTHERASEVLSYEPNTGKILWRVQTAQRIKVGDEAGCVVKHGRTLYRVIKIDGKKYQAHRIAWILYYGCWPDHQNDHIDGEGINNRIDNLRDVDGTTNSRNARMYGHNTSGVNGVSWHKRDKKWQAHIKLHGKNKFLGLFSTIEQAAAARADANIEYGFTDRHGIALSYG